MVLCSMVPSVVVDAQAHVPILTLRELIIVRDVKLLDTLRRVALGRRLHFFFKLANDASVALELTILTDFSLLIV